jgi:predicted MFS family arabinose efflux permease
MGWITALLWAAFFAVNFNVAMMIPLLPFIQPALGLSTAEAGLVLAVFPVAALGGNLALGPWIDRFGRKVFLCVGGVGCTVLFLLTAMAGSGAALVACRAATGMFMPMLGASVFAAVADYVPGPDRARISGLVATAAPMAFLLAMSLGVLSGGYVGWQLPLLLIAAVTAVVAAGAWRLPPTPRGARAEGPVTWRVYRARFLAFSLGGSTRLLLLAFFAWGMAMFVFLGMYPAWVLQRGLPGMGPGVIGAMLFLGEVGGLLGAFFAGRLARLHARPLGVCAIAGVLTAVVVMAMPFARDMLVVQGMAYGAFAFGRDLMLALTLSGAMGLVAPAERGSLNAFMNVVYQGGATLGALAGAALFAGWPNFYANGLASGMMFGVAAASLWRIRA